MKYLFYEKESDTKAKVMLIYHETPPEDLLTKGNHITIDTLPEPEHVKGKMALPYCNPETGEFWYEYADVEMTDADQKIDELRQRVADLSERVFLGRELPEQEEKAERFLREMGRLEPGGGQMPGKG